MEEWIAIDINPESNLMHSIAEKLYQIPELKAAFIKAKMDFSFAGIGVHVENAELVANSDENVVELMLSVLKRMGKKVFITIDEIFYSDNVSFFSHALSSYAGLNYDIYVLMTGLRENIDKIRNNPSLTFLYRARMNELDMLNITAISADYRKTLGMSVAQADRLAFETKGYSLAFQIIGYVYWNALSEYENLDDADMDDIYNEIDSALADLSYDKIVHELSAGDIKVLKAMSSIIRTTGTGTIKVEDIRREAGMTSETLSTYRKRLIDGGILDGSQYAHLRFRLPRLENYVEFR